jgi:hypothetical protein
MEALSAAQIVENVSVARALLKGRFSRSQKAPWGSGILFMESA